MAQELRALTFLPEHMGLITSAYVELLTVFCNLSPGNPISISVLYWHTHMSAYTENDTN